MRLKGKVAIVTGAGEGLGRSIALRYAKEGARVVVAERDATRGGRVAQEINDDGGAACFVATDVSDEVSVAEMVHHAEAVYGPVTILVNNAAVLLRAADGRAHELDTATWTETLGVNLTGLWLCSKYVLRTMLSSGGGTILHMASPTGMRSCAQGLTAYSASKGGVIALTHVMAADYARDKIRVNAIVPGTMATPMNMDVMIDDAARDELLAQIPMGRMGEPEEVDGLAVFLASEEARYCTGGIYRVDGGLLSM